VSVLPDFQHHRPSTVDDALDLISYESPAYAGGTELLLAMRAGLLRPVRLIDLKRVGELRTIGLTSDTLTLGGAVTHAEAIADSRTWEAAPVLAEVLGHVGNPRVRASGTLGGNLCFAEPKSDVATILIALEAEIELLSRAGSRPLPVAEFVIGPYTTDRADDELLRSIRVPRLMDRPAVYEKYQTMERPTVGVAASLTRAGRCRLVIGAVGGTPEMFEGDTPGALDPSEIAGSVEVVPDLTGSERYKRHIVKIYADKVLRRLEELL
jgi:aerobic carbon-monoxide dehydrogenase medium subunit